MSYLSKLHEFMRPDNFRRFMDSHGSVEDWHAFKLHSFYPPKFYRMWTRHEGARVSIHKIYPTEKSPPLYHSHPWHSAILILSGGYEMGVGTTSTKAARLTLPPGSAYELRKGDGWHWISPPKPTLSLMMTWKDDNDLSHYERLEVETQTQMLEEFKRYGFAHSQGQGLAGG